MMKVWRAVSLGLVVALTGCATSHHPDDPLEGYNRAMYKVNDVADRAVIKPVATAYDAVTPVMVQTGVRNFFGNIGDLWSAVNQLMQGRGEAGMTSLMRFTVNSTFGLFGLLDIATEARLQREKSDFGQTLGRWGVGSGPYLVLPLLGPSTVRDTVSMVPDVYGDLWAYKRPIRWRNVGVGVRLVDKRAQFLNAKDLVEGVALDEYSFVRDAYMQRRKAQIEAARSGSEDDDAGWE